MEGTCKGYTVDIMNDQIIVSIIATSLCSNKAPIKTCKLCYFRHGTGPFGIGAIYATSSVLKDSSTSCDPVSSLSPSSSYSCFFAFFGEGVVAFFFVKFPMGCSPALISLPAFFQPSAAKTRRISIGNLAEMLSGKPQLTFYGLDINSQIHCFTTTITDNFGCGQIKQFRVNYEHITSIVPLPPGTSASD